MNLTIPELSLVVLIGPSGAGKSTFARRVFRPTEVVSSDFCRGLVSDDENDQSATVEAFEVLHFIAAKRLQAGRLTVVDATNVKPESRKPLVALARQYHCIPVAIVLNIPERICAERNATRPDRNFSNHVIRQHVQEMRRSLRRLDREGFRHVHVLDSPDAIETATVERQPLWCDRKSDHGPFDIIGDIHGCRSELETLLKKLGYDSATRCHPNGRKAVFLGDLVDRGPDIPGVLRIAMQMVAAGSAICVPGNHEMKLLRKLRGRDVQITHGLAESLAQLEREPAEFVEAAQKFIDGLVSHYVLDDGRLVVAHAGMKAAMQGRGSGKVREFALFGETTGETDEFGLPVRYDWAAEYRGPARVVYGHTPVPQPEWLNGTINIDTGCVFGGKLTALRYPEKELVSVPAERTWCEPARPFLEPGNSAPSLTAQQLHDDVLDMEDVSGKRIVGTRLYHNVTIREENAAAALEVMSRYAADPKWLIYLPPTMAPAETSAAPGLLERPAQAFAYYRHEGVPRVICEEKHMGSRAVLVVCRDEEAARRRFGVVDGDFGLCYTRTGRRFFDSAEIERELLSRVRTAIERASLFEELDTEWLCLDCELMPWSAKAQELITSQYAAVGAAAGLAIPEAVVALQRAESRGADVKDLLQRTQERARLAKLYVDSYRRYCWPVASVDDLRLASFHLLASEHGVHVDKDHGWHLAMLSKLCGGDPILLATPYLIVDLTDPNLRQMACDGGKN